MDTLICNWATLQLTVDGTIWHVGVPRCQCSLLHRYCIGSALHGVYTLP